MGLEFFKFTKSKAVALVGAGALSLLVALVPGLEGKTNHAIIPVPGDVPTLCYGYTKGVKMGDTATDEQCIHYLKAELDLALATVDRVIHVRISEYERAAYGSLVYNIGPTAFARSTIARKVNAGDRRGGCLAMVYRDAMGRWKGWVHVKGRVVRGLVNRRLAEQELCLMGVHQ